MVLSLTIVATTHAAKIAVIDSGLDYKHEMITPNLWTNPLEVEDRRDNDGNGYQDDVHGWNFAEQNGRIIDYKYLGTFSPDCKKFFDIQGKSFLGKATEEELEWVKEKRKDKEFLSMMGRFGNFVHGTHVAGITVENSKNEVMGIKLLPTEVKPFFKGLKIQSQSLTAVDRWELMKKGFDFLASQQMLQLTEIARFVNHHQAHIANGSFGTGFRQAKMITDVVYRILFFKKPSAEDSKKASSLFINALVEAGQGFVNAAPQTLFVFAAGNDGMSNDEFGTSPANIKADNAITVGATYKNEFFAPFSNYGVNMVDIAAPGMLIESAIPGNDYLEVSGTSQAAPYVANVAAQIKDSNPELTPVQIKKILMGTVDKKGFLKTKVNAQGIVNKDRAILAAEMSRSMKLESAITKSRSVVKDVPTTKTENAIFENIVPIPLTPEFK